jgi:outer membrane translocation and assembly module TamA
MGDVQDGEATYKPEEWNYTAGGGLRVDTPLGRVRLDFGYRLNDPGVFVEDRPWAIHFGFGEAF